MSSSHIMFRNIQQDHQLFSTSISFTDLVRNCAFLIDNEHDAAKSVTINNVDDKIYNDVICTVRVR